MNHGKGIAEVKFLIASIPELQLLLAHVQLHKILPKESEQSTNHQHMLVDESHIIRDSNRNQLHIIVKRIAAN